MQNARQYSAYISESKALIFNAAEMLFITVFHIFKHINIS